MNILIGCLIYHDRSGRLGMVLGKEAYDSGVVVEVEWFGEGLYSSGWVAESDAVAYRANFLLLRTKLNG